MSQNEPVPSPRRPVLHAVPGSPDPDQLPLALEWEVTPGVPAIPGLPPALRIVGDAPDDDVPVMAALPDARQWVAMLAQAVSEVMAGGRPVAQLTRWVARDELARLGARAAAIARHPSARAQRGTPRARTVRAVRVCPVAPGVIEASAVLVGGQRAQAIAFRIEARADRWQATVIDLR